MLVKNKKKGKRYFLKIGIALFCVLAVLLFSFALFLDRNIEKNISAELFSDVNIVRSPSFFAYRFDERLSRTGERIDVTDRFYAQRQNAYIPLSEIPQAMIDAFVSIEDKHYFEHEGVDWKRTLAASMNYLVGHGERFGASTITQQLIKNMTGKNEISWMRKIQEIVYARDLEKKLDKSKILELYLNVIHFSDNCNGIGAAAEHYFSKEAKDLTLAECASIAAITNNPSYYNPIKYPENNLERRNLILSQMYLQGYITEDEYIEAKNTPLSLRVDALVNKEGINSWYVDMVIDDVITDLADKYALSRAAATHLFYTKGLQIDMALDPEMQAVVEEYYRTLSLEGKADGTHAQSALIAIDSHTGDILAVAGAVGPKTGNHLQNFAVQTKRAPGSTIKPLSVYAPALEEGVITWGSVYDDVPTDFYFHGHSVWPRNATGIYRGLTDISYAVAHSTNTVAIRVLRELGAERAFRYAKEKFHLSSLSCGNQAEYGDAALGLGQLAHGVTLREITAAYTVFADHGVYHPWRSYYRVTDVEGNVLLSCADAGEVVLSRENAAIMTKLLQGVVRDGTSGVITLSDHVECAGKTGTSGNNHDRWFIGYTPDVVCGVWSGYEYPTPLTEKGISTGTWNAVMTRLFSKFGKERFFSVPENVVKVDYCKDSGKLLTDACLKDPRGNRRASGWFLVGSEPHEFCDCHVLCAYDEEGSLVYERDQSGDYEEMSQIIVNRHFPIEILVSDDKYVYRGN